MNKPDFVIVGAMKAGTSNLRMLLMQHEEVFMSDIEIGYFSNEENFKKGAEWYQSFFAGAGENELKGEKSPNYNSYPMAAKRMSDLLPNAKLIWILREPVSRAYSDYWFSIYRGKEFKSFQEAVDLELKGKRKNPFRKYLYRSNYLEQIREYMNYYPLDQMMFIRFEDMKNDPVAVCQECFRFLGLKSDVPIVQKEEDKNPTYLPRFPRLNYINSWLFMKRIPWLFSNIRHYTRKEKPGYEKIDGNLNRQLKEHFLEHNNELGKLTGLDLSRWN